MLVQLPVDTCIVVETRGQNGSCHCQRLAAIDTLQRLASRKSSTRKVRDKGFHFVTRTGREGAACDSAGRSYSRDEPAVALAQHGE